MSNRITEHGIFTYMTGLTGSFFIGFQVNKIYQSYGCSRSMVVPTYRCDGCFFFFWDCTLGNILVHQLYKHLIDDVSNQDKHV